MEGGAINGCSSGMANDVFLVDCRLSCIAPFQMRDHKTGRDNASCIKGY